METSLSERWNRINKFLGMKISKISGRAFSGRSLSLMGINWLRLFSKRPYASLTVVIVFAAGIRLYLFWQYFCISSDGVRYIDAAQYFYSGKVPAGFSSIYPPLYSLMI